MSASAIASLKRRAAAGETNARDELARIGAGSIPGYNALQRVRAGLSRFGEAIEPILALGASGCWERHPEDHKPELPAGALMGLHAIKTFGPTVLKCRQFRDGSWACAIVIASGTQLNAAQVNKMSAALGLSSTQARCFSHAVQYPSDEDCARLGASMGPAERNAIALGQCVGRARQLQGARSAARMGQVDRVIGWEMGE